MEIGLFQQQSLKLTMSKELSQAISLLQYSSMDIVAFLHEQALQNPLIDFSGCPSIHLTIKKIMQLLIQQII